MLRYIRYAVLAGAVTVAATVVVGSAAAAAPSAITGSVSAVTADSATLNGVVNPNGAATDWWFEYGTTASYGSKTATTSLASGSANASVSKVVTGLDPGKTYHYRLVARNGSGTTNGSDGLFSTASPPAVVTSPATAVSSARATLGGTVDPNGQPTTWYVEYGTTTGYGSKSPIGDAGAGTSPKAVSVVVGSLTAGRTYHFRLVATSAGGTALGADATFSTGHAPNVTTRTASSVRPTTARLRGRVDPQGRPTTYYFEYGTTTAYGSRTSSSSAGSGSSSRNVSKNVSRLKQGTTYHYRLVATSDVGTTRGADQRFTTQSSPSVGTGSATAIGPRSATLGGTVNPNGRSTSWFVEYGTSTRYGSRTSSRNVGSGTASAAVSVAVSNLVPGATYHFRLVASSSLGTTRGSDATFVTTGGPVAVTGPLTFATLSLASVRVNGVVNPRGSTTTWWFEYGRTRAYGFRTVQRTTVGSADVPVSFRLRGLKPGVRWHYRLVARSSAGTSAGADLSFATVPRPRTPSGRAVRCTIVGTQGPDILRGTRRNDVICGLGGNDRIFGNGGADVIYGGPGADTIFGGAGKDILRGGNGNDTLVVRDRRRDVVEGGRGSDLAIADRNVDRLVSVERRRFP